MRLPWFGKNEVKTEEKSLNHSLSNIDSRGGFLDFIKESFTGAWQRNVEVKREMVLSYSAVFSCMTLISGDIGKLRPMVTKFKDGVFQEVKEHPYIKLLKKPNHYQTWQKFAEQWALSKLAHGNTYVYKVRNAKGIVDELHILSPALVRVLVDTRGEVWYQLSHDSLSQVFNEDDLENGNMVVPATEIIHDTMICLFHPLVGVSPIYACGLAATQGLSIQNNSATFFNNMSRPSGILTAPNQISDTTAERLKKHWETNYSQGNIGRLAVLGDGLNYQAMTITAVDSQLLEQLKWTAETVCSCFHVPSYKIGVGQMPTYDGVESLNQIYFTDCLQTIIESMEAHLEDGLDFESIGYNLELELDGLIRMDTATLIKTLNEGVKGGWMKPNEARQKRNLAPVEGGDTPYLQQQNFSLKALAQRDATNPLVGQTVKPNATPDNNDTVDNTDDAEKALAIIFTKTMELFNNEVAENA